MGGQEFFEGVRRTYYSGARVGFIVFDVTNQQSFNNVERWHREIISAERNAILILVGNKVDLIDQRVVSKEDADKIAEKLNVRYIETCALNKDIVDEAFNTLGFLFFVKNYSLSRKTMPVNSGWLH